MHCQFCGTKTYEVSQLHTLEELSCRLKKCLNCEVFETELISGGFAALPYRRFGKTLENAFSTVESELASSTSLVRP